MTSMKTCPPAHPRAWVGEPAGAPRSVSQQLGSLAEAARDAPIDDALRTLVAQSMLSAMGASRSQPGAGEFDGGGPRALVQYYAARIYDRAQDDWYAPGRCHVGPVILPSILAFGAADVFAPFAAGVAAMLPVSAAYGSEIWRSGRRAASFFGPVGAAAATCASIGDGGADEIAQAISLALATTAGHTQCFAECSDEWRWDVIRAASSGAEAALLARAGVRASQQSFEGSHGWSSAHFMDEGSRRLRELLTHWSDGPADVAQKFYASGGIAIPAAYYADVIARQANRMHPDRIVVHVMPDYLGSVGFTERSPHPFYIGSVMSAPRCIAEAYLFGRVRHVLSAADERAVRRVEERVELVGDPTCDDREVGVEVQLGDRVEYRRGTAREAIHRDWGRFTADPADVAYRFGDVRVEDVEVLFDLLSADAVPASALVDLLERSGS